MTAQARSAALAATRVQVIAPAQLGETAIAALRARGIVAEVAHAPDDVESSDAIVAWALDQPPTASAAVELAAVCARAAANGRPVCLLAPPPRGGGRAAIERAAALAYLHAHGAALGHDVDVWLEAVVALVRFGMPAGPRTAVIAPAGSWLEAQAQVLASDLEAAGLRPPVITHAGRARGDEPTDVVLYDPALGPASGQLPTMLVEVVARAELARDRPALYGARAAVLAIDMLGRAAQRIAVGLGPAPLTAAAELAIDRSQLERQLGKLAGAMRVGDHEAKVLLKAYGAPVTRQAVATTPSAAVKAARRARYPVELKPWGNDLPTEAAGCPVEHGITSDALVRRAFAAVLAAAGKSPTKHDAGAVIVREPPPAGRDVAVSFVKLSPLGWTVALDGPHPAAAPAPLRLYDAELLAAHVVASRAGEAELDRAGLANLLRRASHLVVDVERIKRLELARVVVASRGSHSVIADAWLELA